MTAVGAAQQAGPKYFVDIEGADYPWDAPTITTAQLRQLAVWESNQQVVEVDLETMTETALADDAVVTLMPPGGFAKKIRFKRGLLTGVPNADAHAHGDTRPTRSLIGWLDEGDALSHLLGRGPTPQDNLTEITKKIIAAKAAVSERPKFEASDPTVLGDSATLSQIAARPDVQNSFAGVNWSVQWVDLTRVQSVQKFIYADHLASRVAVAAQGSDALADLCFPRSQQEQIQFNVDLDGLGILVSTYNPHLRVGCLPPQQMLVASAPGNLPQQMLSLPFGINLGISYLHVAQYQDRFILRDGTHRAVALLREGIRVVPAVIVEAPSWEFVAPIPGLLPEAIVVGDRPPLLTDFWDEVASADGRQQRIKTCWYIRANRISVPL